MAQTNNIPPIGANQSGSISNVARYHPYNTTIPRFQIRFQKVNGRMVRSLRILPHPFYEWVSSVPYNQRPWGFRTPRKTFEEEFDTTPREFPPPSSEPVLIGFLEEMEQGLLDDAPQQSTLQQNESNHVETSAPREDPQ